MASSSITTNPPPQPSQARIIYAPNPLPAQDKNNNNNNNRKILFLSGSITGTGTSPSSTPWQTTIATALSALPIAILNPNRPDWDASWRQDISFAPLREQMEWELNMMEAADIIALYLHPTTVSPISMLELGLFARSGKMIVACPEGFARRGNVQVVCARFGNEIVGGLEELVERVRVRLGELGVC